VSTIRASVLELVISQMLDHEFCNVCYRALERPHEMAIGVHTEHLLEANQATKIPRPSYGFQGEDEPDKEPELE